MKKVFSVFIAIIICVLLVSCGDKQPTEAEDTTADNETAAAETEDGSSEPLLNVENYTSEIKDPDFAIPFTLADCKNYVIYDADNSRQSGNTIKYYSSGVPVAEETFDANGRIVSCSTYESDGKTLKSDTEYTYAAELSCSINFYLNGEKSENFKFTYGSDEKITSAYHMIHSADGVMPKVEAYEFDSNGNVTMYIDSDGISNVISDTLMTALMQGLTKGE